MCPPCVPALRRSFAPNPSSRQISPVYECAMQRPEVQIYVPRPGEKNARRIATVTTHVDYQQERASYGHGHG